MKGAVACTLLLAAYVSAFADNDPQPRDQQRPNIVFILADDLGWNDVGFTGGSELQTPNIDSLAYNGKILLQHYAQPTCTPSRSALLTAKYPIHTGMQGYPLSPAEPRALPLEHLTIPQYLQDLGYHSHLVGKWHLGYHEWKFTPTARGFDTHFGYLNGFIGYYDHHMNVRNMSGHDFWRGKQPLHKLKGEYVTDLLTQEAVRLINSQGEAKKNGQYQEPMFLLLSHLAVHSGNDGSLHEYPEEDILRFSYIPDEKRRKYAAMVWNLDKSVGVVMEALANNSILDDTIVVFISDNGAQTHGLYPNTGSNFPLRGLKFTLFEGGVRSVAAVWSRQLQARRTAGEPDISLENSVDGLTNSKLQAFHISRQLFHISDWLPTLYSAAGGDSSELRDLDGIDQWSALVNNAEEGPRHEFLVNIDEAINMEGIRENQWKLISGSFLNGVYDGYFGNYKITNYTYDISEVQRSMTSQALRNVTPKEQLTSAVDMQNIRKAVEVKCDLPVEGPQLPEDVMCRPGEKPCLFDLTADPCEHSNLAAYRPDVTARLSDKLREYRESLKPQLNVQDDPRANPKYHNQTWVPWMDVSFIKDLSPVSSLSCTNRSPSTLWAGALTCGALYLRGP